VIVKNDEIVSTGYNGSPRGSVNCCEVGHCWRDEHNIPHGQQYEACLAVHAEQNAIISATRKDMLDAVIYLVGFENGKEIEPDKVRPCVICQRMLINSGIIGVVTK
jgi:dCMP deaminase